MGGDCPPSGGNWPPSFRNDGWQLTYIWVLHDRIKFDKVPGAYHYLK